MLLNFNPCRRVGGGGGVAMAEGMFEGNLRGGTGACLVGKKNDDIPGRANSKALLPSHMAPLYK